MLAPIAARRNGILPIPILYIRNNKAKNRTKKLEKQNNFIAKKQRICRKNKSFLYNFATKQKIE